MLMGALLPLSTGGGRYNSARAEEGQREGKRKEKAHSSSLLFMQRGLTEGALFQQPSTSHSCTYLDLGAAPSLRLPAAPLP